MRSCVGLQALKSLCPTMEERDLDTICQIADTNHDRTIDCDEFLHFLELDGPLSIFARKKILRASMPTPAEHIAAYRHMPSTSRPSYLASFASQCATGFLFCVCNRLLFACIFVL